MLGIQLCLALVAGSRHSMETVSTIEDGVTDATYLEPLRKGATLTVEKRSSTKLSGRSRAFTASTAQGPHEQQRKSVIACGDLS